jgi:DNA polymerase sigma
MDENKIIKAISKAFEQGFELVRYRCGVYGMESFCEHEETIHDIEELIEWAKEKE